MKLDVVRMFTAMIALTSSAAAGPILYKITDLGSLGGSSASANSINASGQTAGTMSDVFGNFSAYSSTTNLTPAGTGALGAGINSAGQVIGTTISNGTPSATIWTGGTAQNLLSDSYGMAINDSGQVTGRNAAGHAFLYSGGTAADLGTLAGGTWSSGYAINANGAVAGYGDTTNGAMRAFLWTATTGFTSVGTLGGANSYAFGLNSAGQVTGSAQTAAGYLHAYLFTGGSLVDLGTLGGSSSYGYGINSSGAVVGYSYTPGGESHAFLYKNGVMYDLNSLLSASGWDVTAAYSINDAGQIAGTGLLNGVEHAILLDPFAAPGSASGPFTSAPMIANPEPGSLLLVLVGGGLLLHRAAKPRLK